MSDTDDLDRALTGALQGRTTTIDVAVPDDRHVYGRVFARRRRRLAAATACVVALFAGALSVGRWTTSTTAGVDAPVDEIPAGVTWWGLDDDRFALWSTAVVVAPERSGSTLVQATSTYRPRNLDTSGQRVQVSVTPVAAQPTFAISGPTRVVTVAGHTAVLTTVTNSADGTQLTWRDGDRAVWLVAGGPGTSEDLVLDLAERVTERSEPDGGLVVARLVGGAVVVDPDDHNADVRVARARAALERRGLSMAASIPTLEGSRLVGTAPNGESVRIELAHSTGPRPAEEPVTGGDSSERRAVWRAPSGWSYDLVGASSTAASITADDLVAIAQEVEEETTSAVTIPPPSAPPAEWFGLDEPRFRLWSSYALARTDLPGRPMERTLVYLGADVTHPGWTVYVSTGQVEPLSFVSVDGVSRSAALGMGPAEVIVRDDALEATWTVDGRVIRAVVLAPELDDAARLDIAGHVVPAVAPTLPIEGTIAPGEITTPPSPAGAERLDAVSAALERSGFRVAVVSGGGTGAGFLVLGERAGGDRIQVRFGRNDGTRPAELQQASGPGPIVQWWAPSGWGYQAIATAQGSPGAAPSVTVEDLRTLLQGIDPP